MSSSTKTLVVLFSLILIVLLGAFSYELYAIHKEGQHSVMLEAQVASGQSSSQTLSNLRAIQTNYTEDLAKLNQVFIAKDNPVPFLDTLENTGKTLGIKLHVISVTVDQGKERSTKDDFMRISFDTEGSWAQTIAFVHALESLPYHVNIDRSSLTTEAVQGTTGKDAPKPVWNGSYDISLNIQQ